MYPALAVFYHFSSNSPGSLLFPKIASLSKAVLLALTTEECSTVEQKHINNFLSAAISTRLTASHPNSEVKLVRAGVVLRWGTTREGPVLRFYVFHLVFTLPFPFRTRLWFII